MTSGPSPEPDLSTERRGRLSAAAGRKQRDALAAADELVDRLNELVADLESVLAAASTVSPATRDRWVRLLAGYATSRGRAESVRDDLVDLWRE